jgi:hypothetical protein
MKTTEELQTDKKTDILVSLGLLAIFIIGLVFATHC